MQSVKLIMREIGNTPNAVSPAELDEYIKENVTSNGYTLFDTHSEAVYLPNEKGATEFKGFRVLMTFVKDELEKKAK